MLVVTKHFGQVELDESNIIHFEQGILGFEEFKKYTLIYDNEDGERPDITWLQSIEEAGLALPVISPFLVKEDYNPVLEDELLKPLGDVTEENIVVLASVTVPKEIEQITANLKAPFIINSDTKKGAQIIVQNDEYEIKYPFYHKLKELREAKGGE